MTPGTKTTHAVAAALGLALGGVIGADVAAPDEPLAHAIVTIDPQAPEVAPPGVLAYFTDADGDGRSDALDLCGYTPPATAIDDVGCPWPPPAPDVR